MPSKEVKRIKRRQMPDGTLIGVWLGASRITGQPVYHAPVTERRMMATGIAPSYGHIHGERTVPGHTFTTVDSAGDKTVRDADGMELRKPPAPRKVYVAKGSCDACRAEWVARKLRKGRR